MRAGSAFSNSTPYHPAAGSRSVARMQSSVKSTASCAVCFSVMPRTSPPVTTAAKMSPVPWNDAGCRGPRQVKYAPVSLS